VSRQAGDPGATGCCGCRRSLRSSGGAPNGWSDQDLQDGFALTGMFPLAPLLEPRGQGHSDARDVFINAVTKHRGENGASVEPSPMMAALLRKDQPRRNQEATIAGVIRRGAVDLVFQAASQLISLFVFGAKCDVSVMELGCVEQF